MQLQNSLLPAIGTYKSAYQDCKRKKSKIFTPKVCDNSTEWDIILDTLRDGYYTNSSVVDLVWTGSTRVDDNHFIDESGRILSDIYCTTKNNNFFKFPSHTKVTLVESVKNPDAVDEFWTNEDEKVQRKCLCYRKFLSTQNLFFRTLFMNSKVLI